MARRGHSAWLLLAAVVLMSAAAATAHDHDCRNATFQAGRRFRYCNALPVLGARLHWTYYPGNGTVDLAFRAPASTDGWVSWGINTENRTGMTGSSVFVASWNGTTGRVSVLTTVLESERPSLKNGTLRFRVLAPPAADYSCGEYTIYATVALPGNSTQQNTVWQAGPLRGGAIAIHPTTGANLKSKKRQDFLSE